MHVIQPKVGKIQKNIDTNIHILADAILEPIPPNQTSFNK